MNVLTSLLGSQKWTAVRLHLHEKGEVETAMAFWTLLPAGFVISLKNNRRSGMDAYIARQANDLCVRTD